MFAFADRFEEFRSREFSGKGPAGYSSQDWMFSIVWYAIVVAGIAYLTHDYRKNRRLMRLLKYQESKVAEIVEGYCRLSGRPVAKSPLRSPVTNIPCLCYCLSLTRHRRQSDSDGTRTARSSTVGVVRDQTTFVLDDGGRTISVLSSEIRFTDMKTRAAHIKVGDARLLSAVAKHFRIDANPNFGTTYFLEEAILPIDARYVVIGHASQQPDGAWAIGDGPKGSLMSPKNITNLKKWFSARLQIGRFLVAAISAVGFVSLAPLFGARQGFTLYLVGVPALCLLVVYLAIGRSTQDFEEVGTL